jgi:hypothetical protein
MTKITYTVAILLLFCMTSYGGLSSWQGNGTWNNKKYGSKGTLSVDTKVLKGKEWTATFKGMFNKKPFEYNVKMTVYKKAGSKLYFKSVSDIGGDKYTWSAYISSTKMVGKFKAESGNNGAFILTKKK